MIDSDTIVRRLDGLVEAQVDDEILALHIDQGICYAFNVTAAHVWNALGEPRRVGDLRDELLAEFEIDPETCEKQLAEVIELLVAQGLVTAAST